MNCCASCVHPALPASNIASGKPECKAGRTESTTTRHTVGRLPRIVQLLGMAVTGIGLIVGVAENDMRAEFMYLGSGIVIFAIGYLLQSRG